MDLVLVPVPALGGIADSSKESCWLKPPGGVCASAGAPGTSAELICDGSSLALEGVGAISPVASLTADNLLAWGWAGWPKQ